MPQDYNIYIHGTESSDVSAPTKPMANQTQVFDNAIDAVQSGVKKTESFITGGFQSYINTGAAMLSKAVPAVALALAAVKIADKAVSSGATHLEDYIGDYQFSMAYNNFKTIVGNAINPVGMALKQVNLNFQSRKFNDRQNEIRSLMGQRYIGV